MSPDLTDNESTLVQVMAWCHQASSHYLNQCWILSMLPYGITRQQWVKKSNCCNSFVDRVPVDFIYGYLIFKWVAVTLQEWEGTKVTTPGTATNNVPYFASFAVSLIYSFIYSACVFWMTITLNCMFIFVKFSKKPLYLDEVLLTFFFLILRTKLFFIKVNTYQHLTLYHYISNKFNHDTETP